MMSSERLLERWARLAVHAVNVQPRQRVMVRADPEHNAAVEAIARAAYGAGADYVAFQPDSNRLLRIRVDLAPDTSLDFAPEYRRGCQRELVRDNWALIVISAPSDPYALEGADTARIGTLSALHAKVDADFRRQVGNDRVRWCVVTAPTAGWSAQVLAAEPTPATVERMWRVLADMYRLDADDPTAFWDRHTAMLQERAAHLNAMKIRELHFSGGGSDLVVGLHERAVWSGGGSVAKDGLRFFPNVPTEECFTAPDARLTRGRAQISRPVTVLGKQVEGAWFEFDGGRVVDFGAATNRDILEAFFDLDAGSRAVGEIALVDTDSPIFQSGLVFDNILLDENAACHLALGFAYPRSIAGGEALSDEQLADYGANRSRQHVDFMIGTPDTAVVATLADGSVRSILDRGAFTL